MLEIVQMVRSYWYGATDISGRAVVRMLTFWAANSVQVQVPISQIPNCNDVTKAVWIMPKMEVLSQ